MKKFGKMGAVFIMAAALPMAACGSSMPELTEEQNRLIVEYAAGLLLKYDENYSGRLVEIEEEPETAQEAETPEEIQEEAQEEEPVTAEVIDNSSQGEPASEEMAPDRKIEEFYGIEGVSISYTGYEIRDTYPEEEGEDLFFAMNASAGSKLLIFNFDVMNVSGQDLNLDMGSYSTKFKISINGASPRYALTTMLMNDLASFTGVIPAGASENLVLVSEIPEEEAGTVQAASLLMRNASEDAQLALN